MKVAIFVDNFSATGVVANAIAIAGELQAAGMAAELVANDAQGTLRGRVPDGVAVVELLGEGMQGSRRSRLRRVQPELRRYLRNARPDLLFSAGNHGHLASMMAALMTGRCRTIVRISNEPEQRAAGRLTKPARHLWRAIKLWIVTRLADRLVFVSRHLLDSAAFARSSIRAKSRVIPNGVDIAQVRQRAEGEVAHPWLGSDAGLPLVLGVGRLVPQKNFTTLVRAVAEARRSQPMRLLLIGSGPREARLREEAERSGLGEDFAIIPPVPNPMPFLARAAVLALPSWWEGASNVLLEALALGTPVVASRTAGSAPEVLDGGHYGLLVDPADASELAAALLRQVGSNAVRPGNRASEYSRAKSLAAYVELVRELGSSRG